MLTRSQLWAAVLLVSTFAAGAVVGGGAVSLWGDRNPSARRQPDNRGPRGFAATLRRELNLNETQHDSVRSILRRYDPAFRSVMEGTRPQFDSLRALVHADIRRVLEPAQQDAFTAWVARTDSATARRRAMERDRNNDRDRKEKSRAR